MAAIKLILKIDGPHVINDLGLTIEGVIGDIYDLVDERAQDVSDSTDLRDGVTAGSFVVLDPRDPAELIELSPTASNLVLENHNQVHWGVVGGRFGALDNPNTVLTADDVVVVGPDSAGSAITQPLSSLLNTPSNLEAVQDIVGDMFAGESDVSYNDATGALSIDDNFLRNTGDTVTSGVLTIGSGAALDIASGGSLTIQDDPVAGLDAVNKAYVDAVATGLDYKESVLVATSADLGWTYANNGTGGPGDTLTAGAVGTTDIDGVTLSDGDRVLIKNQSNALQNGIYVASATDAGSETVLTRAEDQDGSQLGEVSAGNTVYVEGGSTTGSTGWVVIGVGIIEPNTDPIVWTQHTGTGTYLAGEGISLIGRTFAVVLSNVSQAPLLVEGSDELIIGDSSDSGDTAKTTFTAVLNDLDIVHGITTNGFTVRTAEDTYVSREIEVDPAGDLGGLVISNPTGNLGNPVIGLDIQNTAAVAAVDLADLLIAYDVSEDANVTYTIEQISDATASDSFKTWTGAGNTTGDANVVADIRNDEITITGGAGVNVNFDSTAQDVTFSITGNAIAASAGVVDADEIVVFDPVTGAPTTRTLGDVIEDLDILGALAASTAAGEEGVIVDVVTDPSAPTVGLDINNLADSADALAATDEVALFDGTNNVSMNGQQIADGVQALLGLPVFVKSTINGQEVVTVADGTRGDKLLSVDSNTFMWSENSLGNNDWVQIAGASDADSGYIMPMDGTIVMATAHCENATNASTINIYNGASTTTVGAAGSFTASANAQFVNTTLNIDFVQGDRIRLRNVGGTINDTVISMYVKWRA